MPPKLYAVLVMGLWYSGVPQSEDLLVKLSPHVGSPGDVVAQLKASAPRPTLMEIPLEEGAWVLDALWGGFMATGDAEPVVRIMSALRWADKKGDIDLLMIGRAAQWSLTSNAQQHPRVLAICRAQLANQPAEIARVLRQVISDAEGKRAKR